MQSSAPHDREFSTLASFFHTVRARTAQNSPRAKVFVLNIPTHNMRQDTGRATAGVRALRVDNAKDAQRRVKTGAHRARFRRILPIQLHDQGTGRRLQSHKWGLPRAEHTAASFCHLPLRTDPPLQGRCSPAFQEYYIFSSKNVSHMARLARLGMKMVSLKPWCEL